jgi:hypothetical protein
MTTTGKHAQRIVAEIVPTVAPGWHRTGANLRIAPDGLTIEYQFVDEEIQVAWSPYVTEVRATYTERAQMLSAFITAGLEVECTALKDVTKVELYDNVIQPLFSHYLAGHDGILLTYEYTNNIFTRQIKATAVKRLLSWSNNQSIFLAPPKPSGVFFSTPPAEQFKLQQQIAPTTGGQLSSQGLWHPLRQGGPCDQQHPPGAQVGSSAVAHSACCDEHLQRRLGCSANRLRQPGSQQQQCGGRC